jgi:hypothetical protein
MESRQQISTLMRTADVHSKPSIAVPRERSTKEVAMATKKTQPGGSNRKKWPKSKEPITFMVQPDEYEIVPPARLAEWERLMQEQVGFPRELVKSMAAARMIYTLSFRGGQFVD